MPLSPGLDPTDLVGVTFWLLSAAMFAATFFFYMERPRSRQMENLDVRGRSGHWYCRHPLFLHARRMGRDRCQPHRLPLRRLASHSPASDHGVLLDPGRGNSRRSIALLAPVDGLRGHACRWVHRRDWRCGFERTLAGSVIGTIAWLYIVYEIFAGEASKISAEKGSVASKKAFNAFLSIVTVGWSIYPLGYIYGYAETAVQTRSTRSTTRQ